MKRHRYRFVFRKEGDVRFLSHRDLLRLLERALRRTGLRLALSQGFHPKPRIRFPLALALGLAGYGEWMEIDLHDDLPSDEVQSRLQAELPEGLTITRSGRIPDRGPNMAVDRVVYRIAVSPAECQRIHDWIGEAEHVREGSTSAPPHPDDTAVRSHFRQVWLQDGQLYMEQRADEVAGVGPRQLLEALGLADLERNGHVLARVAVSLHDEPAADAWTTPSFTPEQQSARS